MQEEKAGISVNESTDEVPAAIRQMQGKTRRTIKGGGGKKHVQPAAQNLNFTFDNLSVADSVKS